MSPETLSTLGVGLLIAGFGYMLRSGIETIKADVRTLMEKVAAQNTGIQLAEQRIVRVEGEMERIRERLDSIDRRKATG